MSQREFNALMRLRQEAERLYERLTVEQMEHLAANMQVVEAVAEGRVDVLDQFVPVRLPEEGEEAPSFPWKARIELRRYPVVIDAAVPWAERIPNDLHCESARIFMMLRAFIPSSRETLRLLRVSEGYVSPEEVARIIEAAGCRPATVHHLVAFMAVHKLGVHGWPDRVFATGSAERIQQGGKEALLVPRVKYEYDIDAECVERKTLGPEDMLSASARKVGRQDCILAVESP
jgi:hypothetical protein